MIRVGLTGGIGTGKTVVARIFSELQVPVYFADTEAKKAYLDAAILQKARQLFGDEVLDDNILNYKNLARIVFNDKKKLSELNSLIHPFIISDFEKWAIGQKNASYIIMEAAILFETSLHVLFDKIIAVTAPEELCIDRVMKRDGISRAEVVRRSEKQIQNDIKATRSDYVIINDGTRLLLPQVLGIHKRILESIKI
ncbi:MAG TPA: dephospho-CoA kinase [Bacteroidales bacterium]|nr:dephospho-CoA kinase [Bacteroidales bacterium]